jgi:hypothetical protein
MTCGTSDRRQSESRIALLSQEGSAIETAVEIARGVVPEPQSFRMQSETFRMGNHPSPESTATMVFGAESILDSSSV